MFRKGLKMLLKAATGTVAWLGLLLCRLRAARQLVDIFNLKPAEAGSLLRGLR